jgi:non-ribosomal peptide synthetase component F
MTTLAAFLVMLSRYTRQDDLCVGTAVANRRKSEVEGLIGMIVNNLVLRTDVSGNPTFRELLSRVRETTLEAFANEDLPFDKVVEVLKPVRNLSYNPLFQAMFSFHDTPLPDLILPGLKITTNVALSNKSTKFDLDVVIIPNSQQQGRDKGITVIWEYNTDLFDAATIQQMVDQYQNLLETIVVQPNQQIRELPLLTPSQQRLLGEWNQTDRENTQSQCIHKLFELQVELTPDAIALKQNGQKLTYRELSDRANKIAHYLQSLGVKPETLVGICVDRSLEMIAGLLGILKAGGAYVPIDPAYPQERISEMIVDTQLSILLTQNRFQEKLTGYTSKTICLDTDWAEIASQSTANPVSDVQLNNLAYIIYTSGSTGKPKGVMIEHRSLLNFVVQGAWSLLISRYTGEKDVIFGATVSGRQPVLENIESMVGLLINTIPTRVKIDNPTEILSWLKELQTQAIEQEQYSYFPLAEIQQLSDILPGMPLFESLLVFENYPVDSSKKDTKKTLEISNLSCFERTNYPLTIVINPGSQLRGRFVYDGNTKGNRNSAS